MIHPNRFLRSILVSLTIGAGLTVTGCVGLPHIISSTLPDRGAIHAKYVLPMTEAGYTIASQFGDRMIFVDAAKLASLQKKKDAKFFIPAVEVRAAERPDGQVDSRISFGVWFNGDDSFRASGPPPRKIAAIFGT